MELRHLRYFCAVARTGHVGRAAASLHITQSTLSHQIQNLENELGVLLFDRIGRGIRVTRAGETFVAFAEAALERAEAGRKAVADLESLEAGHLRVGMIHTFLASLAPPVCVTFNERWPGVQLTIEEHPGAEIERRLGAGELDVGIAFFPTENPDLEAEPLFDEALKIIVSREHPLAARRSLAMRDLPKWPLALLTRAFSTRWMLDTAMAKLGTAPYVALEMNSIEALVQTVRLGRLATVLSKQATAFFPELRTVALTNPTLVRRAGLLWRRQAYRSRAAQEFVKLFRAAVANSLIE